MTKSILFRVMMIMTVSLFTAIALMGQAGTGNITGIVTDANGAVVKGATVTLTSKETNQTQTTTTSDDGVYNFVLLRPGSYTVKTNAPSFGESTLAVDVTVGRTVDANVTLTVGGVAAVVTVTNDAIQTTQSNSDAVVNEAQIQNLPINGRRFQDFVTLTPTAQVDPSRGQISLSGQKGINGNVNVDGVDYNQPFFGGIRGGERSNLAFTIPQESIKEFQVVAAGYSAEFGRSTGGVVNAVTKSGDNSVRGSAFYLLRPNRLAKGNEYTDALEQGPNGLLARGITPTLAPTQHQWGGSIGGPVVQDRFFYFGSYEQQRFRAPRQVLFQFPANFANIVTLTPAQQAVFNFYDGRQGPYTQTNDAWAILARGDWQVNNDHRAHVRYSMSRNNALNAASRGETVVDPTTRQDLTTNGTEQDRTRIVVGQMVSNFGSRFVNEARFQWAHEERPRLSNSLIPQVVAGFATIGAGGSDTSSFLPNREYDDRYQFADSFTWIKGNHAFKFGGEFSHIYAFQTFGFNQFGQYFASLGSACVSATNCTFRDNLQVLSNVVVPQTTVGTTTTPAFLGRMDSTSSSVNVQKQIGNLENGFAVKELAFFGQDQWRINQNLTINYGLRAEVQYNPSPETGNTQVINVLKNTNFPYLGGGIDPTQIPDSGWQWGPRAGFAWDPKADGKTVVRGYAGVYYARTPLIWLAPAVENFRTTPANVSTRLPFALGGGSGFSQTAFDTFLGTAAGAPYRTITGCDPTAAAGTDARNRCTPNSVYRQFAIAGINLNSFALDNMPVITNAQISSIASALGFAASPFVGAQVIPFDPNYKNPRSTQWGIGVERQMGNGLVLGVDYSNVNTRRIGRFRDVNIPAPLTAAQYVALIQSNATNQANNNALNNAMINNGLINAILTGGRTYVAIATPAAIPACSATVTTLCLPTGAVLPTRARPATAQGLALGAVGIHESTGKSLYRALTFRMRLSKSWVSLNAYYTFSDSLTDDDNERQEGVGYADPYDLRGEYAHGRLHFRNQFQANPVFYLPWDFEVSSAIRLRSGAPFNATVGADLNGDTINNDRPFLSPGVIMPRNYFRNRRVNVVDLRVQKTFEFDERKKLVLSSEFFNIFNNPNLLVGGSAAPSSATSFGGAGQFCATTSQFCGLSIGPGPNPNFNRVYDPNTGAILTANVNPGTQVFQMQLGARFYF